MKMVKYSCELCGKGFFQKSQYDYRKLSAYTSSQTSKNGYKEEELVCKDLNNEAIKRGLMPILGNDYNECSLQRKGGDRGKRSSNQLQIKLILSNLVDKVSNSEYKL